MVHVHYTLVEHLERCDSDGLHWKYPLWSVIQKVSFTLLLLLWPFISVILLNMYSIQVSKMLTEKPAMKCITCTSVITYMFSCKACIMVNFNIYIPR